jgi:hypothetical protein
VRYASAKRKQTAPLVLAVRISGTQIDAALLLMFIGLSTLAAGRAIA